jgi:hypothetical protein
MRKAELLDHIRRDRAALEAVIEPLSDTDLIAADPDGGWSPRDHLAHIAAWERMIVAHLTDRSAHTYACMTPEQYVSASLDELNARLHELLADDPLAEIMSEVRDAHAAIFAYLETMPESRLDDLYWGDDAAQRTVLEKVSGDTYKHYREHAEWIGELVAAKTSTT